MPFTERLDIEWVEPSPVSVTRGGESTGGIVQRLSTDEESALLRAEQEARERRAEIARSPFIEQVGGRKFSRELTALVESGHRGSPQALELVQWIWDHAPVLPVGEHLSGMQAAALLATGSEVVIGKLAQRIEFISTSGGRRPLELRLVAQAVRREIAHHHCRCAAKKAKRPDDCSCLDEAFFVLSDALLRGKVTDTRGGTRDAIDERNAWGRGFLRSQVLQLTQSQAGGGAN